MLNIERYIKNPSMFIAHFVRGKAWWMPDRLYLKILFKANMGYRLDLDKPRTFNEKLQWLKLYDRKDIYTQMVDKASVKDYVASVIGNQYIIPTIGVWDRFEDINFDDLPEKFVIKCTHDSHTVIICTEKKSLNIEKARKKINQGLKTNYYLEGREWPYKNVIPRVIIEKNINCSSKKPMKDYKFYCFNGQPKIVSVTSDRGSKEGLKIDYYDIDLNRLDIQSGGYRNSSCDYNFPKCYSEMVDVARKLSSGIPHVRVDLYCENEQVFFGELTFFDSAGFAPLAPKKWDEIFGDWIQLPEITDCKRRERL